MKNVSHKKSWNVGAVQVHVDPPTTPLIKIKHDDNSDKYFVKLELHRDLRSDKSDLYQLKIALFENGDTEDFLLFVRKPNTTIEASGMLGMAAKVPYICMLICGEAFRQFYLLSADVEGTNPLTVETIILGFGA